MVLTEAHHALIANARAAFQSDPEYAIEIANKARDILNPPPPRTEEQKREAKREENRRYRLRRKAREEASRTPVG